MEIAQNMDDNNSEIGEDGRSAIEEESTPVVNLDYINNCKENYHIVNSNFREKYKEIEQDIKTAAIISMDAEFSGLTMSSKLKNSLFDAGRERYEILKKNVENFIVIQVGLTTFHFNRDDNKYDAHMYNFFIFPKAVASVDRRFCCQASSLQFLSSCSFDFNKFIYEGIPYLNEEQEKFLLKELLDGKLFQQVERSVPLQDERTLQKLISRISVWALSAKIGEVFTLQDDALAKNEILVYIIHKEIRRRFCDLWTESTLRNEIVVKKIEESERNILQLENGDRLERDVVDYFIGFSKIIRLLISLKKPIVGHNLLIDLLIMYNQFIRPLPDDYKTFKKNINTLFPKIFDTKLISYELRKVLKREDYWASNAVLDLYRYLSEGRGKKSTLYRPEVKLWTQYIDQLTSDIVLHEAGWDSYICGYCFIQMGHYFACLNYGLDGYERPLTCTEHISGVTKFMNKVNIVRASIAYLNLGGDDPPTNRPKNLLVKTKNGSSIDTTEVTELLAKYCSIDIKVFNNRSALVAVSNYNSARQILKDFVNHKKYSVTLYHPIRDSQIIIPALWSGLIISGGICIAALVMKYLED